jgi:hypothetical protein
MASQLDSMKGARNKTLGRFALSGRIYWLKRLIPAIIYLGLVDKARAHYWRFMAWVCFNHPEKAMFALTRAIAGYHFIRYTAEVMIPRLKLQEQDLEMQQSLAVAKSA